MVRVWFFSISFPIFMIMCVWYLILICVFLIFELCRVLEDLMRKITDGRHGWNLYWMNTFLFNASYMPTHTRVNVICIVWIAWMGLYVHSVCLIIKTTVLFRYAMCFFFWVKKKKKHWKFCPFCGFDYSFSPNFSIWAFDIFIKIFGHSILLMFVFPIFFW